MEIKKVAVVGAGTMGNGIAHVFAQAGYPVALIDSSEPALLKARAAVEANLGRMLKKNLLTAEKAAQTLNAIRTSTDLASASGADLVVEAVFEDREVKKNLFKSLDSLCAPAAILASNTSSIPISELASATRRGGQVAGMHFMNPVPVMKLVEVISARDTSPETIQTIKEICLKLGKTPVQSEDRPGFIANRILMPMINEACFALMEGLAAKEDIDAVMVLGMSHPMGPLALADYIGLDVCLSILEILHQGFRDDKYRPCPLLARLVSEGKLGRKSGRGFYEYP
ncbi:MAG: 3-hydroxybutyryl-CoA dehydrogenase [Elusimicrobia bacterium]|nr:3-hydroxybutyryl-CoA dehydrogenase [Elusimicrobiota bacterium]